MFTYKYKFSLSSIKGVLTNTHVNWMWKHIRHSKLSIFENKIFYNKNSSEIALKTTLENMVLPTFEKCIVKNNKSKISKIPLSTQKDEEFEPVIFNKQFFYEKNNN